MLPVSCPTEGRGTSTEADECVAEESGADDDSVGATDGDMDDMCSWCRVAATTGDGDSTENEAPSMVGVRA
jgi:hypothetical protein